ncbi:MAG: hypothetical protein KF824_06040 [Fimbriimonadaceae bacterium]|nr:MAG: hypothetical protein KF824_06040 [Fimbriimonadaceae bacterium]
MKKAILGTTVAMVALGMTGLVIGQSAPQPRKGTAESRLISVSLYDTGAKVISIYGSPDEIQALNVGTAGATGGGGEGGGRGGPPGGGGAGTPQTGPDARFIGDPFGAGDEWRQLTPEGASSAGGGGSSGPPAGGGGNAGGGGRGAGGGGGTANAGTGQKVIYTRWVYKRNNSRYAFVFDKFNRCVQIEAVGLSNSKVKTRRGITFGSSFGSVIKAYNAPDGYEINGDNIVVRFLVRDRVAFRLSRIKADKPHVVTGVVVAAGKT